MKPSTWACSTASERRRALARLLLGLAPLAPWPAQALMAGRAPDSPVRRLDPNRADSPHACVASVMGKGGVYSAVCIAPRFALTAAHVVQDASDLRLYLNLGGDLTHRLSLRRIVRHPAYGRLGPEQRATADLAVLELAEPVPSGVRFPPLARTEAREGLRLELVGHGASGRGDQGLTVAANAALRRVGANRIDRLLRAGQGAGPALIYLFTFGGPGALPNHVEAGLASGDSGSPAFVQEDGRLAVFGINTFVTTTGPGDPADRFRFGALGGGQVLAPYRDWLRSVIGAGTWAGLD